MQRPKISNQHMDPSVFICYQRSLMTGISLPMEMISAANTVNRINTKLRKNWHCHIISGSTSSLKPIELTRGLKVTPGFNLTNSPKPGSIFLPPIWGNPDIVVEKSPDLIQWLIEQHNLGVKICATGTAVCLLAKAGLLDGKVATTHWYYFDTFKKKYPRVNIQKHHFITQSGSIFCIGSINSLVDLTLYFIENTFGKEVSQVIERHFNHEVNRTYDKPWFATGASRHPDEGILEVQRWMKSHYNQTFNLQALSEMANMSVRNFSRRFKAAVGKSVLVYGQDIKMEMARELLKETNLSLQDISDQIGIKDNAYFSRLFKNKNDLTPTDYREMVRGKLFNL